MKAIQIFDPAMCCNSGVCGANTDQALVNFAADVRWAQGQGAQIERFNLAQQPMAFAGSPPVRKFLETSGIESLPLLLVDGQVVLAGRYPVRGELALWADIAAESAPGAARTSCAGNGCC